MKKTKIIFPKVPINSTFNKIWNFEKKIMNCMAGTTKTLTGRKKILLSKKKSV